MKRFLSTLSVFAMLFVAQLASAQLVPGPSHPKPPPYNPNPPPYYGSCLYNICTGDTVFNSQRNYRKAVVVGIEARGTYVLRFLDTGGVGGNWSRYDLATTYGCGRQFCVGDLALNASKNYRRVRVIGVEFNGTYVLNFLDTNGVGGNWSDFDLVRAYN
jgi:hypothetical protein